MDSEEILAIDDGAPANSSSSITVVNYVLAVYDTIVSAEQLA